MDEENRAQTPQTPPVDDDRLCRKCRKNPRSGKNRWCSPCIAASRKTSKRRPKGDELPGTRDKAGRFTAEHNQTFKRGPDAIPRGNVKLMFAVAAMDTREARYKNLCKIHRGEAGALAFLKLQEITADRLEGKPTQHIVADHRRTTTFVQEGQATPVSADEAQAAVPAATEGENPSVDLAALPVSTQALAVLPPPQ